MTGCVLLAWTGAKVNTLVKEVITNTTSFERIVSDSAMDLSDQDVAEFAGSAKTEEGLMSGLQQPASAPRPSSHRLVVHPRFPFEIESHGCKLCPANLCKVWLTSAPSFLCFQAALGHLICQDAQSISCA